MIVVGEFVVVFFEVFFCWVDECVEGVVYFDLFVVFFVFGVVGFGVFYYVVDFFVWEVVWVVDGDFLFFVGVEIFGWYVGDVVGVDVEGYLDLWYIVWCWWDVY